MLDFNIRVTSGTDNDAVALQKCLSEWDDFFEGDSPSLFVEGEDLYGHADDMDEMDNLAISIAKALPASDFLISGRIDTSESAGEYMNFLIEYRDKRLISKHSSWYVYMWADDFDEYEDFAENYQDKKGKPRYTKEQFEAFQKTQHFVLESGRGACVPEVPLEHEKELDVDRQAVCPICREALHQGVPVCEDKTGKQYHIWCAEEAKIKTQVLVADGTVEKKYSFEANIADTEEIETEDCYGLKFVVTGKLKFFENREEIVEYIEDVGGAVTETVSKNTDYLICNDVKSNSSKMKKAKELGIAVLSEVDFIRRFADPDDVDFLMGEELLGEEA